DAGRTIANTERANAGREHLYRSMRAVLSRLEAPVIFSRKSASCRAGGLLVVHSKIFLRVQKMRWRRFVLFLALLSGPTILSSCGGSSAVTPTISVFGAAGSINVLGTVQFTATVQNLSSTLVSWQVDGVANGNSTYPEF